MKTQNIIFSVISLVCVLISFQSCNNIDGNMFEKPANSVKSIETRYYEPILLNDKWITGAEIADIHICPKIEYFDEFNNVLLKKELRDSVNKRYDNFYTRTFYFDPQAGKMSKQIKLRADSDLDDSGARVYNRDTQGRLTSITTTDTGDRGVAWWNYYEPESISYDIEGNKTEKQGDLTTITKKIHSDPEITVYMKQVIKDNSSDYYRGIYGLVEYEIITTDTKTSNEIMIITEKIQYETLSSKSMTHYKYNKVGSIVEEEIYKIESGMFHSVPTELSQEEQSEYIKDNYFGSNIEYKSCYKKIVRKYDYNNNLICKDYLEKPNISPEKFPVEFNIQNYSDNINIVRQMFAPSGQSYTTYYQYEYNKVNDWVKRIKYKRIQDHNNIAWNMFDVDQDNWKDTSGKQVEEIIIRKIEYYN